MSDAPRKTPNGRSSQRRSRKLESVFGIAILVGGIYAVVSLAGPFGERRSPVITGPSIAETVTLQPGQTLEIQGESDALEGCRFGPVGEFMGGGAGEEWATTSPPSDTSFSARWTAPSELGRRLAWFEMHCDDELQGRWARQVDVVGATPSARAEVLRMHVDADWIETTFAERLPRLLNDAVPGLLADIGGQLDAQSESLSPPDWVISRIEMGDETNVRVRSAQMTLDDDGFAVALDLQFTAEIDLFRRPLLRRGRPERDAVTLRFSDRFQPAQVRIEVTDDLRLRTRAVELTSTTCDSNRVGWIRQACTSIVNIAYRRVESWLEARIDEEIGLIMDELDLDGMLTSSVMHWAESVALEERTRDFVEGANFALARTSQDQHGFALSLEVERAWLGIDGPARITLDDSASPIDIGISFALTNHLLAEIFDRPFLDALGELEGFASAYGGLGSLEVAAANVRGWGATAESNELEAALRTFDIAYNPDFVLRPLLWAGPGDVPMIGVYDLDVFQSTQVPGAALSVSAATPIEIQRAEWGYALVADERALARHIAIEALVAGLPMRASAPPGVTQAIEALGQELELRPETIARMTAERLRLSALAGFSLEQLMRTAGWVDRAALIEHDIVHSVASLLPPIPGRFPAGPRLDVVLDDVGVRTQAQTIQIAGHIEQVP